MMKNLNTLAGMIIIMLCHGACHTRKFSNGQHVQNMGTAETNIKSNEQENRQSSLSRSIVDSIGQEYHVTIFPADSFRFSVQDGFSGKATKIEFRGSARQLIRINDSITIKASALRKSSSGAIRKTSNEESSRSQSVKKSAISWIWVWGMLALGLEIMWVWKYFRLSRLLYSF